jgi:serine/threonine-protein kinase
MSANDRISAEKPQLLFELARGGMATVHLARTVGIGGFERFVVVKRILDPEDLQQERAARFLSEAKVAARIHHANVVGTHQVGIDEQGLYMVLDYVEGGSLATLVDRVALRGEMLPIPLVLRIALDALAGLHAVHSATSNDGTPLGIVHRDVSLQNVLIGRDGIARLADFGIARSARAPRNTKTGSLVGKLLYLPPEYIRQEPIDATADIYMLGVTLWCALTTEDPWHAKNEAQLMHCILNQAVPSIAAHRKEAVAPEIEALVRKACHPNPRERFESARQMTLAIDQLGRDRGWVASQHELAQFVERHLGVDLDRRRERIARAVAENTTTSAMPSLVPSERRDGSNKVFVGAVAAGALLLAALSFLFYPRDDVVNAPHVATENRVPSIAGDPTQSVTSTALAQVPQQQPISVVTPIPSASGSSAVGSAIDTLGSRRPTPGREGSARPRGATSPPSLAAPDHISERNPYREPH